MLTIGLTIGDPSGIGPELLAAAAMAALPDDVELVLYGAQTPLQRVGLPAQLSQRVALVEVLPITKEAALPGQPDLAGARLQVAALQRATDDALQGRLD